MFNPKARPWIDPEGASTEEIVAQIEKCPSGALSYYYNADEENAESPAPASIEIKIAAGGPLLMSGEVKIIHKDGSEEIRKNAALCRCGLSQNKPFCDGSHRTSDFDS